METEVLVAPLVSLMTKALPVPALVNASDVVKPVVRSKEIFLPTVVAIEFPAS